MKIYSSVDVHVYMWSSTMFQLTSEVGEGIQEGQYIGRLIPKALQSKIEYPIGHGLVLADSILHEGCCYKHLPGRLGAWQWVWSHLVTNPPIFPGSLEDLPGSLDTTSPPRELHVLDIYLDSGDHVRSCDAGSPGSGRGSDGLVIYSIWLHSSQISHEPMGGAMTTPTSHTHLLVISIGKV